MDEKELEHIVGRVRLGDVAAFEVLVRAFEGELFRFIGRHGPREEVEVIAQESFLSAYQSIERLREAGKFQPWLHGIAIRKCRDAWRSRYRRARVHEQEVESGSTVEMTILAREILESVSAEERVLLTLLYIEGESTEEVARLLGISQVSAKVRAHRLKRKISKWVSI